MTLKSPLKVLEAKTNMPALEFVGVKSEVKILFQAPGSPLTVWSVPQTTAPVVSVSRSVQEVKPTSPK